MAETAASRRRPLLIGLLLVLVTGAVFGGILSAGFVRWDDGLHVYANPYLHPVSTQNVARFWTGPYQNLYVPVSYSLYALLAAMARLPRPIPTADGLWIDLNPHVFHAAGLALHLVNVLLVFALLRRLLPGPKTATRDWAAGVGALLFAIHPVQVESVAWIAELRGLLSGLFSLLALHAWLSYVGEGRGWRPYALATACFGLALLAKPSAVTLPLLAIVLEVFLLRRPAREWRGGLGVWGLLSVLCLWLTHGAQPVTEDIVTPLWTRPFIAGDALAFYFGKLLWPVSLGIDYGRSPVWLMIQKWHWLTPLVPIALVVAAWFGHRRAPWLAASAALFAAALLPTLGLTPFVFQVYSTVADRYLYLALLGPALAAAWGLALVSRHRDFRAAPVAWGASAAVLLLLALSSRVQTACWQSSLPLFVQALAVNPQSWGACNNLGAVALDIGRPADALPPLTEAVRLRPGFAEAHANRGIALLELGQTRGAEDELRQALRLKPGYAGAETWLGESLLAQGRAGEAAVAFRQALTLNPGSRRAQESLRMAERETPLGERIHPAR